MIGGTGCEQWQYWTLLADQDMVIAVAMVAVVVVAAVLLIVVPVAAVTVVVRARAETKVGGERHCEGI